MAAADLDARDATGCGVAEHVGDRVERAARLQYDSDRPSAGSGSVGDFANRAFRGIAAERHRMRLEKTRDVTDQPRRGQACALERGRDLIGLEEAVAIGGPVVDQRVEQRMSEPGKRRAAVGPDSLMRVRACGEEAKADRRATREIQLPPSGRNEPACDELAHAADAVQAHRRIETQGIPPDGRCSGARVTQKLRIQFLSNAAISHRWRVARPRARRHPRRHSRRACRSTSTRSRATCAAARAATAAAAGWRSSRIAREILSGVRAGETHRRPDRAADREPRLGELAAHDARRPRSRRPMQAARGARR